MAVISREVNDNGRVLPRAESLDFTPTIHNTETQLLTKKFARFHGVLGNNNKSQFFSPEQDFSAL